MAASEYHHGEMDASEQKSFYSGFMSFTKWNCLFLAALLVLLVVWFCTPGGVVPGLISGLVVLILGWMALKKKPGAAH
jgi:Na+/proline symporter